MNRLITIVRNAILIATRWIFQLVTHPTPILKTIFFVVAGILFILLNIYAFRFGNSLSQRPKNRPFRALPTPTPTPRPMREHGRVSFGISGGNSRGPQFSKGFIDPVDPELGTVQKLGIWVQNTTKVEKVTVTMNLDHGSKNVDMKEVESSGSATLWQGSWTVNDTYLHTYTTHWEAKNANGTNFFDSTWR